MEGRAPLVGIISLLALYFLPYTVLHGGWTLYAFYVILSLATLVAVLIDTEGWRGGD